MTDQLRDSDLSTADLVDRYGDALTSIPVQFRSFFRSQVSVRRPRRNGEVLRGQRLAQVDNCSKQPDATGKVLVVDGGGSLRSALVGDLIAGIAVQRGWAGLVILGRGSGQRRSGPARPGNQ